MPAGDASRTWFAEMIEALRQQWRPAMAWEDLIALRDRLDAMLDEIRSTRGIRPPTLWCAVCQTRTQQASPSVSVRAMILAVGRFSIGPVTEIESLERRWTKHRKENGLDRNGKPAETARSSNVRRPEHPHTLSR